ncbi:protein OPAQUE10-like [Ipomoea triloba]|uniref:protein OPAQUE10-like n=1 Tax=Ipomoea triloba TaxID=35885 RepID=UPI00125E3AB8|nr:protein OPAQUE10-like [Ipomoea triloba]
MGRLELSGGGASQSSFRELDDVFLQTQTRIWLGEVLNMRLDEQIPISDLLADGDLLCEVSKVIWNMLTAKYAELRHLKYKPIGSRKRSGRYMPYSNVDSFLAICKILGLDGIDLFSPSDVVEKRNTRKVCICVRAVSKKVRSKQLNVPNFDMVTCAVAMPKDMVGGIKRSLETSKSSISSSSSYNSSYNYQRSIVRQRNLIEACDRNYDSCSEGSDEAESKYMGGGEETEESYCSSTNKFNDSAAVNSDCESLPVAHSGTGCGTEDGGYDNDAEGNYYISDYLAFSDSIIGGHEGNNTPVLRDGEDNMLNFFSTGIDSFRGRSGPQALHEKKNSDDIEDDLEVSSTASVSSILDRALNLEFDEHLDVVGSLLVVEKGEEDCLIISNCNSQDHQIAGTREGLCSQGANLENSSGIDQSSVVPAAISSFDINQVVLAMEDDDDNDKCSSSALKGSNDANILQSPEIPNQCDMKDMDKNLLAENGSTGKDGTFAGLSKDKCDTIPKDMDGNLLAQNASNTKDGTIIPGLSPKDKVCQKPLLLKTVKTVASGTAIFGLLFLLLHLRRERGKSGDANRKLVQSKKFIPNKEGQSGATARIYPAEKLKFKNY